jgi:omega-hydroxy-beta-dihydromenaquinone-9 sulfotransferase
MPKSAFDPKSAPHNWYPPWAPRFWNGMRVRSYLRLLRENRFDIDLSRYPMTALVGICAVINSTLGAVQNLTHGKRIANAEMPAPPIFVIGHWRSGTTLMHELLALDQQFAYPSNFDAFVPNHFLLSRFVFHPIVRLLMPANRPMDNMEMGVGSPQEDDFALCAYGAPTPYRRIAFPNRTHRDHLLLNIANASEEELYSLEQAMKRFLDSLTVRYQKQLILKSPPHTGRVIKLAQWFPGAKFIHISRHPYDLVPSTMRLWKTLDQLMGFQFPRYDDVSLKNYIFECQDLMYAAYHQQRSMIPTENLIEIRFEDLVGNPLAEMERVYRQLQLNDFDRARPLIESYFNRKKSHQKNRFALDESLKMEIDARWPMYMEMFGYQS